MKSTAELSTKKLLDKYDEEPVAGVDFQKQLAARLAEDLIAADPEAKGAPGPAFANRALAEDFGYDYEAIPETGHLLQIQKQNFSI